MKVRNAVVGMEVQVKRDCCGYGGEFIKGGLVCNVSRIDYISDDYELRLEHPDIDDGFAWANASDVRRYIKPTEAPEPAVEPDEPLTKGSRVSGQRALGRQFGVNSTTILRIVHGYTWQHVEDSPCTQVSG